MAKEKGRLFSFDIFKKKKTARKVKPMKLFISILQILAVTAVMAGIGVGFVFLQQYVEKTTKVSSKTGLLELLDVPEWVNENLKDKIYKAAIAGGENLKLDDDAALSVQQNLESQIAWLANITVQTTNKSIEIRGIWRKPLGVVKIGTNRCYVDRELIVLNYVDMTTLPIVKIDGLSAGKIPPIGTKWRSDDLEAAVDLIYRLDIMDKEVTAKKPLLCEIDRIDVSNYNGRKNNKEPHIVLYTKNEQKIIWGAEIGAWQKNLEATDEDKLNRLYKYYLENGTLLKGAKYINLLQPFDRVPLPIDKY